MTIGPDIDMKVILLSLMHKHYVEEKGLDDAVLSAKAEAVLDYSLSVFDDPDVLPELQKFVESLTEMEVRGLLTAFAITTASFILDLSLND